MYQVKEFSEDLKELLEIQDAYWNKIKEITKKNKSIKNKTLRHNQQVIFSNVLLSSTLEKSTNDKENIFEDIENFIKQN